MNRNVKVVRTFTPSGRCIPKVVVDGKPTVAYAADGRIRLYVDGVGGDLFEIVLSADVVNAIRGGKS